MSDTANAATDDYARVSLDRIIIPRDERQRREIYNAKGEFIDSDGLLESVRKRGVINPLVVTRDFTLVAGERRLEASRTCGRLDIPIRFLEDMSEAERREIELEENIRRLDLPWRDEVTSIAELHEIYRANDPKWTQADTAKRLNYSQVREVLRVARDIDDPKIAAAGSVRAAANILTRRDERATHDAVNDIIDAGAGIFDNIGGRMGGPENGPTGRPTDGGPGDTTAEPYVAPTRAPPFDSILNCDFIEWADAYEGPSFNFIHCDFPYGINLFAGKLSGRDSHTTYDDSEDTYTKLIEALCRNLDKLMSHSAHLMFWLSADVEIMWKTVELFRVLAPSLTFRPKPLIWHKTDNVGIIADPKQDSRHVYETALVASREARPIIKSVSDTYGAPTDKSYHPSTKPEPVLRHFFSMFVDEHARVLDPTCGGGSSLRAAESLGASFVFGVERDKDHYEAAQSALRTFRTLRKVAK